MPLAFIKCSLLWMLLNALLTLGYPAPEPHPLAPLRTNIDLLIVLVFFFTAVRLAPQRLRQTAAAATAAVVILRLFRSADELVPYYLNRQFNLYTDPRYLPDAIHLLWQSVPAGRFIATALASGALLGLICWAVWKAFLLLHDLPAKLPRLIYCLPAIPAFLFLLGFALPGSGEAGDKSAVVSVFPRVAQEIRFVLNVPAYRRQLLEDLHNTRPRKPCGRGCLSGLHPNDVYLVYVESYGHTVYSRSEHFDRLRRTLASVEHRLKASGYSIFSHFLNAPTYGGASWLSHGTVAGGVHLNKQMRYNMLIASDAKPMAAYFNDAGYRTVSIKPGIIWPWPEGRFFQFKKTYIARDFDYRGPKFGWSPMPDQYVLDYILRHEIRTARDPLFMEIVLSSVHAPFHELPPFLENWALIGDGTIYHRLPKRRFDVTWPDLTGAAPAYIAGLEYDLRVLEAFLTRFLKAGALIVVMGDHQPNVRITGPNQPWSVPIHVLSRNGDLLKPFEKIGFTPGMVPRQKSPHPGMETLLPFLLSEYGAP